MLWLSHECLSDDKSRLNATVKIRLIFIECDHTKNLTAKRFSKYHRYLNINSFDIHYHSTCKFCIFFSSCLCILMDLPCICSLIIDKLSFLLMTVWWIEFSVELMIDTNVINEVMYGVCEQCRSFIFNENVLSHAMYFTNKLQSFLTYRVHTWQRVKKCTVENAISMKFLIFFFF